MVRLLPGATYLALETKLAEITNELDALHGFTDRDQLLAGYVEWAAKSLSTLQPLVAQDDIDALIRTSAYWHLHALPPDVYGSRALRVLDAEIAARERAVASLTLAIRQDIERWQGPEQLVVPDTSFIIEHEHELDAVDARKLFDAPHGVRFVIPMIVVDELENLKRVDRPRVRARSMLRTLERSLTSYPDRPRARLHARDDVTVEVLTDPSGHARAPIADDEIVDRAVAVQRSAGRTVVLATCDTSQALRARIAGLRDARFDPINTSRSPRS